MAHLTAKVSNTARRRVRSSPLTPAQLNSMRTNIELGRQRQHAEIVADLGHDDGWWSWQSSPHVLWLANALEGKI